jgi:xylose isomerase
VRVLDENGFGRNGEFVGLDVKVVRTQPQDGSTAHLANSRQTFLRLLEKVRTVDKKLEQQYIDNRDYEGLDNYILRHLMGLEYSSYTFCGEVCPVGVQAFVSVKK